MTGEVDLDGFIRKTGFAILAADFRTEHGAHGTVDVVDVFLDVNGIRMLDRWSRFFNQFIIQRDVQMVILNDGLTQRGVLGNPGL